MEDRRKEIKEENIYQGIKAPDNITVINLCLSTN